MDSKLPSDKEIPSVPLKTYQWEDLRRAREGGGYPWTHLLKPPIEGDITAEDIIRETTPRRSMSREFSRSRTRSPVDDQKILYLDASPGSSRKHGDEGKDEGVQIPHFSKELSLEEEVDKKESRSQLPLPIIEIPRSVSPKGILKRRAADEYFIGVTETREKTKCCHPLVNKIKHLADKTLQRLEKTDSDKSPTQKRRTGDSQEIRQLKSSPGGERRKKLGAIKLGDSDEMSKTLNEVTTSQQSEKDHIYEDIGEKKQTPKVFQISQYSEEYILINKNQSNIEKETDSILEKKSLNSQDPSLINEDDNDSSPTEHIMNKLHKIDDIAKEALVLDEELDDDEPNVEEVFQNQLEEIDGPDNVIISEIIDDDTEELQENNKPIIESSPSPIENIPTENQGAWSKTSSDHEYELIENPIINMEYKATIEETDQKNTKIGDELSSTTSLERQYLQNSDEEFDEETENYTNEITNSSVGINKALQKDIEDRYFNNTPSIASRTECEISTSQVDSSALENLPLKRENRTKNSESIDSKIQQRLKEGTGKLKTQAGKLKSKLQSMKAKQFTMPERPKFNFPERPKFNFPDRPKFKMPERPKISFPDRPKLNFPDKRKFSLPERPKFKKINVSEKLTLGDKKKFSLRERPKFNMPDLSKLKFSEKSHQLFSSLGRKSESKQGNESGITNIQSQSIEYETKTYPRLLQRKKKTITMTTSSPSLNREATPPPVFKFIRKNKIISSPIETAPTMPHISNNSPEVDNNKQEETDKSSFYQESTHVINEINNDEFFVRPRGISRENIQVREYLSNEIRQAFHMPKNSLANMGSSSFDNYTSYENDEADPELMLDANDIKSYSNEELSNGDDGYYTFPPVRPSRAKRKQKELESVQYIDDNCNENSADIVDIEPVSDMLYHQNEYENSDMQFPDITMLQSQTLPMPPNRKKKDSNYSFKNVSLDNIRNIDENYKNDNNEEIIVYRTEHEYIMPDTELDDLVGQSPIVPTRDRNRSRCSQSTSLFDDDRTSHGAESLTLDTNVVLSDDLINNREIGRESPGYATVDKTSNYPKKPLRRCKTPPLRRRKSDSTDRKYYTVGSTKDKAPDRPPRKKSSSSLVTLNRLNQHSSGDITQYEELDNVTNEEMHRDLISGAVLNKMKDRPLPPPPRPPRESKGKKKKLDNNIIQNKNSSPEDQQPIYCQENQAVDEIEVSTQTDPLPDDIDFEFGMDEILDISACSSLRETDEDQVTNKSLSKIDGSASRPASKTEKSFLASDPKISEMSKSSWGRTSPTVILVERRVSSPTRINQREEMLTEASLTVQHIDIDETKVSDVPLLPMPRSQYSRHHEIKDLSTVPQSSAVKNCDLSRNIQLETLVTERLQVRDLDVGRLNVSELQANKIKVSDIEGMSLQVSELDSKSGHISVSGIEFSQNVIDEIVKKFSEISTNQLANTQNDNILDEQIRPESREEQTQTENTNEDILPLAGASNLETVPISSPPERPPPPDLTPLLYSYLHDINMPSPTLFQMRVPKERPFTEFHESQHHSPPPPVRRSKRRPATPHSESSSNSDIQRPSPRRVPHSVRPHEPTVTEAGAQFIRVCHNSISRSIRNLYNTFMTYVSGTEDKRDVQMALVIFLVLIAGLILFGISDSRTIHHHHWEFFNPPDSKPL